MSTTRKFMFLALLAFFALPLLAADNVLVPTVTGEPIALPPTTQLDVAAYLAALVLMMAPVWGAAEVIGRMFNLAKDRMTLIAGVAVALLAHATGIPGCVAPGGPILGYIWAVVGGLITGAGAQVIANGVINPLTPKTVDMTMKDSEKKP